MGFLRFLAFLTAFLFSTFTITSFALASGYEVEDVEHHEVGEEKEDYDTLGDYPGGGSSDLFRCSLDVQIGQDRWFDGLSRARQWCGGFGEFSQFCRFEQGQSSRYLARFSIQRQFRYDSRQSYARARGNVFGQYYDFLTGNSFFRRDFNHSFRFSNGCH